MTSSSFLLGRHVRDRILPALADIDGVVNDVDEVKKSYDALVSDDLEFDLRIGPRFRSNLCAQNASLELGATFGRDVTGVRFQCEPVVPRRRLKNRYTVFRDRLSTLMRSLDSGYDDATFRQLWGTFVQPDIALSLTDEPTITIGAIHHYKDRPPRVKAYFGCDYVEDRARAQKTVVDALAVVDGADTFVEQMRAFQSAFDAEGSPRMVGFDFEPKRAIEVKLYMNGDGLSERGFLDLVQRAGGSDDVAQTARAFVSAFSRARDDMAAALNLVCCGFSRSGTPTLKLYVRPLEHLSDAATFRELAPWFSRMGRDDDVLRLERLLESVAPFDALEHTTGFFNYVSVDVTADGLDKTSVYVAPQVPLSFLAQNDPARLPVVPTASLRNAFGIEAK